jgi:hypothetical protein
MVMERKAIPVKGACASLTGRKSASMWQVNNFGCAHPWLFNVALRGLLLINGDTFMPAGWPTHIAWRMIMMLHPRNIALSIYLKGCLSAEIASQEAAGFCRDTGRYLAMNGLISGRCSCHLPRITLTGWCGGRRLGILLRSGAARGSVGSLAG